MSTDITIFAAHAASLEVKTFTDTVVSVGFITDKQQFPTKNLHQTYLDHYADAAFKYPIRIWVLKYTYFAISKVLLQTHYFPHCI